jgi:hypothetical protein
MNYHVVERARYRLLWRRAHDGRCQSHTAGRSTSSPDHGAGGGARLNQVGGRPPARRGRASLGAQSRRGSGTRDEHAARNRDSWNPRGRESLLS